MTNKSIAFDCRYINPDSLNGIGRFSIELFAAASEQIEMTAIVSDERQLEFLPKGTKSVKLHSPTSLMEPFAALKLNKHHFDIVFSPMQTIGSLGKNFKLILTIHDLIYFSHPTPPSEFNWLIRLGWRLYHLSYLPQRVLLRGADQVVTVSNTSKRLIENKKLTKRAITVVTNGSNQLDRANMPIEKKLVYMGSFLPYKNVETLIRGMAYLKDYKLVLLSKIGKDEQERLGRLASKLGVVAEFLNGVDDEEYANQLSSATALVHASSDEGFGIPIVEAMSLGCPVVCSDIPIFREIAGSAGLFFEIGNYQQFASQVLTASKTREQLSQMLIDQAAGYQWKKSAQALVELFRRT